MSLGEIIPTSSHHNLLFALPTWQDNIDYRERSPRVMDLVRGGYPRFEYHRSMKELCRRVDAPGDPDHRLAFPSAKVAAAFREFCAQAEPLAELQTVALEIPDTTTAARPHVVVFPEALARRAWLFWAYTGLGVSSRMADFCLAALDGAPPTQPPAGADAKRVLRERISAALVRDEQGAGVARCLRAVGPDDVFLYPSGMAAIWSAHQLALAVRPPGKSVCFGFGYVDTLKVIQSWGPGHHFFGDGGAGDLEALEELLATSYAANPSEPPVLALFCESPANPLLKSVDLPRLRALADRYDFLIIVDDTVGSFVNVDVLPYADIIVTSLTKSFSGAQDLLAGSLVLNPNGKHYDALRTHQSATFDDIFWHEDAAQLERNSRDFVQRVRITNQNAETLADFLHAHCGPERALTRVLYPKWETRALYDLVRRRAPGLEGAFGCLFNLVFRDVRAAAAFYDALKCHKGPSLGSNFTLACAFTIIGFYEQIEWAAQYGVELASVRMSVGMEPVEVLLDHVRVALDAAEETGRVNPAGSVLSCPTFSERE